MNKGTQISVNSLKVNVLQWSSVVCSDVCSGSFVCVFYVSSLVIMCHLCLSSVSSVLLSFMCVILLCDDKKCQCKINCNFTKFIL